MTDRVLRFVLVFIAIGTHILAWVQYQTETGVAFHSQSQKMITLALLGLSFLSAGLLLFIRKTKWKAVLLTLRAGIVLYVGAFMGNRYGVELSLLISLLVDIVSYNPFWKGLLFSALTIFAAVGVQPSLTVFGIPFRIDYLDNRLFFCAYAVFITLIVSALRFQRENQVSVVELNRRLEEATVELAQANMKLQEYAIGAEQEAKSNERKRLAREIHDTLAYTLTNLVMMMEAGIDLAQKGGDGLVRHLELARDQAKGGLAEVRNAVNALRPTHMMNSDGLLAIHRLVKAFEKATQITVKIETADAPLYFGEEAGLAVFRLVQEGLTNALRHGRASEVSLFFSKVRNGLYIKIEDNGVGSEGNGPHSGYGLVGMRERIEQLGGELDVSSAPGKGFALMAWIPLEAL